MTLYGLDFTSRPTRQKPLTLAEGTLRQTTLHVTAIHRLEHFPAWEAILATPGPWLMACDFPFGLPRDLLRFLAWPCPTWAASITHLRRIPRAGLEPLFKTYRDAHPAGQKYAHRATDLAARSSPSMKLVNPPVGLMLYEGAPRLLDAHLTLPGLHLGDPEKIALEAYPALLARAVLGRTPYKNDTRAKQTPAHHQARATLLAEAPALLHLTLALPPALAASALADPSGDTLDALLCLLQAAHSTQLKNYGLPPTPDPLEGHILGPYLPPKT